MDNSIPVLHKISTNSFMPPPESDKQTSFQKGVVLSLLSIDKRLLKISDSIINADFLKKIDHYYSNSAIPPKTNLVPNSIIDKSSLHKDTESIPFINNSNNSNTDDNNMPVLENSIDDKLSSLRELISTSNQVNNDKIPTKDSITDNSDTYTKLNKDKPDKPDNSFFNFQKSVIFSLVSIDKRLLTLTNIVATCCSSDYKANQSLVPNVPEQNTTLPMLPSPETKTPEDNSSKGTNKFVAKLTEIKESFLKGMKKRIDDFKENSFEGMKNLRNYYIQGLIGPLNLIVQPLQNLFGTNFVDKIGSLFSKIIKSPISLLKVINKGLNNRLSKMGLSFLDKGKVVKPKRTSVLNSNPEIVWLADEINGNNKKDSKKSVLGNFIPNLKSIAKLIPGMLLKAGVVGALVGSLVWSFVEGIKGIKLSKEWGVSKIAGFIGAFLGGTGSGFKNPFASAGRWALLGVSTGFIVGGPVGALAGGLIGAAIGGIFGFIGGKNIAKGINKIGDFFKGAWDKITDFFVNTLSMAIDGLSTVKTKAVDMTVSVAKFVSDLFLKIGDGVKSFFKDNPIGKFLVNNVLDPIQNFFTNIGDFFEFLTTMNPIQLAKTAISGAFDKNFSEFKDTKNVERTLASDDYQTYAKKQNNNFNKLSDKDKVSTYEKSTTSVHDAIIAPSGRIVTPDKDDTIIATKSPVSKINTNNNDSTIQILLSEINKKIDYSKSITSILDRLDKLITTIEKKPFNNVAIATQNSNIDFNRLRGFGSK